MKNNHKCDFRKSCIKRLKFVSTHTKYYKNKIVVKKLKNLIDKKKAKNILFYIPLGFEVDILPLLKSLRKDKNITIYVPYMIEDSFKVVKFRLPLYKKSFGIKEPYNSHLKAKKLDLAIIPIIGVDNICKRVGFGKGMYDRFFWELSYKPIMVFTQLELCMSKQNLSNIYDIQADYIITS